MVRVGVGERTTAPECGPGAGPLGRVTFPVDADGVILGRDSTGRPVLLRVFDQTPRRVAFIGGWWALQVLVGRCLAHGATVAIDAGDDAGVTGAVADRAHWLALDRLAGASRNRVRPIGPDVDTWAATAEQPVLRLHDVGASGPAARPQAAWHTDLTVLPGLSPATIQAIVGADVVLVQRLTPPDAELVRSTLILGTEYVPLLGALDNEMIAAFGGGAVRYAWLTPTPVERQLFG